MERPGRAGFLVSTRGKRPLTLAAVPRRREAKKGFEPVEIDERMSQTKPLVSVLVGSRSDWETMRHAVDTLARFGVPHEARVLSAHRTPEAVAEYVRQADAAGVDFSLFDNDGPDGVPSSGDDDGVVDALVVMHAGTGAEGSFDPLLGADAIWSHKSDMADPYIVSRIGYTEADSVRIGPYDMDPEIGEVGVYAHEYGHILGLPDLYRTYADETGATKPMPEQFLHTLAVLGVRPEEAAHIGDLPETDLVGARSVGMRAILFLGASARHDGQSLADAVFEEYSELETLLEMLR